MKNITVDEFLTQMFRDTAEKSGWNIYRKGKKWTPSIKRRKPDPKVKKIIRTTRIQDAQKLADDVLKMNCPDEISSFITNEMRIRFPEDFDRNISFEEKLNPASNQ